MGRKSVHPSPVRRSRHRQCDEALPLFAALEPQFSVQCPHCSRRLVVPLVGAGVATRKSRLDVPNDDVERFLQERFRFDPQAQAVLWRADLQAAFLEFCQANALRPVPPSVLSRRLREWARRCDPKGYAGLSRSACKDDPAGLRFRGGVGVRDRFFKGIVKLTG
jgi:hypothetical protein